MNESPVVSVVQRRNQKHGIEHRSLTLSLPGDLARRLREYADLEQLSMSRVATEAITKHLRPDEETESAA